MKKRPSRSAPPIQEARKRFMQEYSSKSLFTLKLLKIEWGEELSKMESDINGKIVSLFIATVSLLLSFFSLTGVDFLVEQKVVIAVYFVGALIMGISYFCTLSRYSKDHRLKFWQLAFLSDLIICREHCLCRYSKIRLNKMPQPTEK